MYNQQRSRPQPRQGFIPGVTIVQHVWDRNYKGLVVGYDGPLVKVQYMVNGRETIKFMDKDEICIPSVHKQKAKTVKKRPSRDEDDDDDGDWDN